MALTPPYEKPFRPFNRPRNPDGSFPAVDLDAPVDMNSMSYQTMVLKKIRLTCGRMFTQEFLSQMRLSGYEDHHAMAYVENLEALCVGMEDGRIQVDEEWPATWWDAFKARWFPAWWPWPAKYKSIHVDQKTYKAVCPHHCPDVQGPDVHVAWLAEQDRG